MERLGDQGELAGFFMLQCFKKVVETIVTAPLLVKLICEDGSVKRDTVFVDRVNRDLIRAKIQYRLSLTSSTRRALSSFFLSPTFDDMMTRLCSFGRERVMLDEKRMVAEQGQSERYDKKLTV